MALAVSPLLTVFGYREEPKRAFATGLSILGFIMLFGMAGRGTFAAEEGAQATTPLPVPGAHGFQSLFAVTVTVCGVPSDSVTVFVSVSFQMPLVNPFFHRALKSPPCSAGVKT